jgi:hypothetical protein
MCTGCWESLLPVIRAVITWEWLIMPLFESFATLVLPNLVISESSRRAVVLWMNDILATLSHCPDERPRADKRVRVAGR